MFIELYNLYMLITKYIGMKQELFLVIFKQMDRFINRFTLQPLYSYVHVTL